MNVVIAAVPRKGRTITMPKQADAPAIKIPKDATPEKARVTKRRAPVAPTKTRPTRKASGANKPASARRGSKTAKILDLLKRTNGASLKELGKVTGWLPHSLRGFLSGALRKKMKLSIESFRRDDAERAYRISS
jgi:Protein of unknown function (DUF3489)